MLFISLAGAAIAGIGGLDDDDDSDEADGDELPGLLLLPGDCRDRGDDDSDFLTSVADAGCCCCCC